MNNMALLTSRCAPQLPRLWIRHTASAGSRARGGLLVPPLLPRQDNWGSAVAAYSAVVAARGAGCRRQDYDYPSSPVGAAKKKLLLQRSAPAQPRLFCSYSEYPRKAVPGPAQAHGALSFARNRLQDAVAENHQDRALEVLAELKAFAGSKDYYTDYYKAKELILAALLPLARLCGGSGGGKDLGDDDVVMKESLAVACLLLRNAPAEVGAYCGMKISQEKEVKTSLERIRDRGGSPSDCDEVRKLANKILARLPSTPN